MSIEGVTQNVSDFYRIAYKSRLLTAPTISWGMFSLESIKHLIHRHIL